MDTFQRLINLFSALREIYKLAQKIERKWHNMAYVHHQFSVLHYDLDLDKKIIDELSYPTKKNTAYAIVYTDKDFSMVELQSSDNCILFDLSKKEFVMVNGKDLSTGLYISKETDILSNIVNNTIAKILILDDRFIEDKLQHILLAQNFNIQNLAIEPLFKNYYNEFINSITNRYILSKVVIIADNKTEYGNSYLSRYLPLFGYYIAFNVYDDICPVQNQSLEQFLNELNKLKAGITKTLLKYDVIENYDYFNLHVYKNVNDVDDCYINIGINFEFRDFLDMIVFVDMLKIIQKI